MKTIKNVYNEFGPIKFTLCIIGTCVGGFVGHKISTKLVSDVFDKEDT